MSAPTLRFPASHPAFPGHFPGAPMVPGALLLAAALAALGLGAAGTRIAAVKFLRPVGPDEEVELRRVGATRLELRVGGLAVASVTLQETRA
jgi:3-hydroxymyristoyl/3-hydroxydecanoyl-(acyl carrier protein) dehydratase